MSVKVHDHDHEEEIVLEGVGKAGAKLIIQTGTIIFDFGGSSGGDWTRDQLTHNVLTLPPTGRFNVDIKAIASASPATMNYVPEPTVATGLVADGNLDLNDPDPLRGGGDVQIHGHIRLPVTGSVPIPLAGWGVDQTRAVHSGNHINLVADLAVLGPSRLMRLAYSLFVTISPHIP
jgi:hypothetical protein